jgi:transcriptional regulator with XRE-family HTH domain
LSTPRGRPQADGNDATRAVRRRHHVSMSDERIAGAVGRLLQASRAKARMSQQRLAERAETSQQWVSRVERGTVDLRLTDAQRLFAAVGARLVVRTAEPVEGEARDPDLFSADELAAGGSSDSGSSDSGSSDGGRDAVVAAAIGGYLRVFRVFAAVPYVVGGRIAALAQGMPVRPYRLDLIIGAADVAAARAALGRMSVLRWSDRLQDFCGYDIDVGRPGERRWRIAGLAELAIDVLPERPVPVTVVVGGRALPVVPLTTLVRDDPDIAELDQRLVQIRSASATDQA